MDYFSFLYDGGNPEHTLDQNPVHQLDTQGYGPPGPLTSSIEDATEYQQYSDTAQDNGSIHYNSINQPIFFIEGQFSGAVVRGQLIELQKAERGRKYVLCLYCSEGQY